MCITLRALQPWQVPREGPIKPASTLTKDGSPFNADSIYKSVSISCHSSFDHVLR